MVAREGEERIVPLLTVGSAGGGEGILGLEMGGVLLFNAAFKHH